MQTTSQIWRDLWAASAPLEARALIGGAAYTDISAPVINRATMQDRLAVGNVVSASLALAMRGAVNIPRSAAVVIEVRLNDGETASEWLPQGTFYVSRRMRDPVTGVLALECYDALLKANAVWTPSAGAWPRTLAAVTAELAALLGVALDSRTVIPTGTAYAMSRPAEGSTIRDALSLVAQAAGGNWIMTPAGRLRLARVGESGDTVDVAGVVGAIDVGPAGAVTGVRSTVDGVVALTGDDTGIVVDVTVAPVIAAALAEGLIGQVWQPFRLDGAIYDPAAELGDGVRAGAGGEVASALCSEQAAYGPAFRGNIAAPDPGEVTDEYPYIGSANKTLALAKAAVAEAVDRLDGELTQQEIFNRLTDDGAAQGLVLYNGQLYINASYINAGFLNVGRINFNEPDSYYDIPNESDPASLLSGQTIVNGWIVNTSGSGLIEVFSCGFAIPLRGKTVTVTFAFNGNLEGGEDTWTSIGDTAEQMWSMQDWLAPSSRTPANPYTYTITVPGDAMSFSIAMQCAGVKQIAVSLSSPVTPTESIVYNYEGQRLGQSPRFQVYRDGTLITSGKSIFNNVTRISMLYLNDPLSVGNGGTGATTAAGARTNLGITPANIGAVAKAGDTMTGKLTFNKVTNAIAYTGTHATYDMIKFKDNSSDTYGNGIVIGGGGLTVLGGGESADAIANNISTGGSEQLCLCNDGAIDIYTNCQNGASSATHVTIDINGNYSGNAANVTGTVAVGHGGTGATTAAGARSNLGVPSTTGSGASGTWGINVSGSAGSVAWGNVTGKPNRAGSDSDGGPAQTVKGAYTGSGGRQTPNYFGVNKAGFLMMNTTVNGNSHYKDWLIMDCYAGSDVGGGVAIGVNRQALGAYIMRSAAARSSWAESAELLGTHNYTSYCPTKTGSGASGTWGISVTGNAANVTGTVAVGHGGTGATTAAAARTNLGAYLNMTSSTYSVLLGQLQSINTNETCGFLMTNAAAGLLSRVSGTAKLAGTHTGIVTRTGANEYRFLGRGGLGGRLYSWVLTTGTSSASTDAVYKFDGTAI